MANGSHGHWRAKHRRTQTWQTKTIAAILRSTFKRPIAPLAKARLVLTRHSSAEPDFDGLVHGFKPIVDALVKMEIIENDKPSVIGQPSYRYERAGRGKGFVTVEVWEAA